LAFDLGPDTRLFLWTLSWDVHALFRHPLRVFDANMFFPAANSLAFSEHLLGSALLAAPWLAATGNPLLAMNVVALGSCFLSACGAFVLARRLGLSREASLAAGCVFAFAPPRFFRLGQLHLAAVQWMPFCLAAIHGLGARRPGPALAAAGAWFTLQALTSGHGGLFLLLAGGALLVYRRLLGGFSFKSWRPAAALAALVILVNLPFAWPYFQVRREAGLRRSLDEAAQWSPNAASFVAAPTHAQRTLLSALFREGRPDAFAQARAYLFPGFLTLGLSAVALSRRKARDRSPTSTQVGNGRTSLPVLLWDVLILLSAFAALAMQVSGGLQAQLGSWRLEAHDPRRPLVLALLLGAGRLIWLRKTPFGLTPFFRTAAERFRGEAESRTGVEIAFYGLLAAVSLWASLGPAFGLYSALHRTVPGWDFVRVPSRLTILTLLSLAVLAAAGADRILRRLPSRWRPLGVVVLLGLLVGEFAAAPLAVAPVAVEVPAADRSFEALSGPLVELPVADPRDEPRASRLQSQYLVHSTAHWQKLVNGYSGFTPSSHDQIFRLLARFPDESSLEAMEALGVRYAVIHPGLYLDREWAAARERLAKFPDRLEPVRIEDGETGDRIYRFARVAERP
jgi:hypothetical protein